MSPPPLYIEIERSGIFMGDPFRDVSGAAFSMSCRRGRTDYSKPFDTGTISITFRNTNGDLDPDNTASTFKDVLNPNNRIRVIANAVDKDWETDPDARPVFVGYITEIIVNHDINGDSTVTITAADSMSQLGQQQIPAGHSYSQQNTSNRVKAVTLGSTPGVGIAQFTDDIVYYNANSNGRSICAAQTTTGPINALAYLHQVATTEQGEFFIRRTGGMFLADRDWLLRPSQFTFTDTTGGTKYNQIERLVSWAQLYTQLQANRTAAAAITVTKSAAFPIVTQDRLLNLGEVLFNTNGEVTDMLDFAAVKFTNPVPQVASLTTLLDDKPTAEQLALLDLDLTDTVTVNYSPVGMAQLQLPAAIQQINHNWTVSNGWRMTFSFVPRNTTSYLVLNDPTLGKLNENALAF